MGWVALGHTVSCDSSYLWQCWVCLLVLDIKLMERVPITAMRSMYMIDTDSITDNILWCCKGGETNVVYQLLIGREGGGSKYLLVGMNICSLRKQIFWGINFL